MQKFTDRGLPRVLCCYGDFDPWSCHSEERGDEESVVPRVRNHAMVPETLPRFARPDSPFDFAQGRLRAAVPM